MEEKRRTTFYSRFAKTTTWILLLVCVAGFILSVMLASYVAGQVGSMKDLTDRQPYWETTGCGAYIAQEVHSETRYAKYKPLFETDGNYDETKTIDILNPDQKEGKKNKDTTFETGVLQEMLDDGVLDELSYVLEVPEDFFGSAQEYYEEYHGETASENADRTDASLMDVTKGNLPLSGVSLEQQIRERGNEGEAYGLQVFQGLSEVLSDLQVYLEGRNVNLDSNIKVFARNTEDGTVFTNVKAWEDRKTMPEQEPATCAQMLSYTREDGQITYHSGADNRARQELQRYFRDSQILGDNEEVLIALDLDFASADPLREVKETYEQYQPHFRLYAAAAVLCLVLGIVCFVIATIQAGKREQGGEIFLNRFDQIPTEAAAALTFMAAFLVLCIGMNLTGTSYSSAVSMAGLVILGMAETALLMGGYLSLVRRCKAKTLWENSLTRSIVRMCCQVYEARQTSSKVIILFLAFILAHLILSVLFGGFGIFLALIGDVLVLLYLVKECAGRETIKEGLRRIAGGDLNYKIDTSTLKGDNVQMADCVNSVGDGLQAAVEQAMKDERLKAELITNVSHDIKTPLTSIINYVDLLKREKIQDEKIQGYIQILDAKSQRLKQLTDDLIEASKVSTGNVELHLSRLQVQQLLQQACGEFEDKLAQKGLVTVLNQTEEPVVIHADGKQLWRIFENLLNNICKYAMPGTRVYIDLKLVDQKAILMFKNVSEYPLNISVDELTERFTRGDASRSTQGSGLGLSIAKNLTQLQGGQFEIYLDGDLFKVTLVFPTAEKSEQERGVSR